MRTTVVSPKDREVLEQLRSRAQEELAQCQLELDEAKHRHTEAIERLAHLQALLDFEDRHLDGQGTQQVPPTAYILDENAQHKHFRPESRKAAK
jgi:hypothetical protein